MLLRRTFPCSPEAAWYLKNRAQEKKNKKQKTRAQKFCSTKSKVAYVRLQLPETTRYPPVLGALAPEEGPLTLPPQVPEALKVETLPGMPNR